MKKFFSILAMSAIVLGMASCGDGNNPEQEPEPEVQNFNFKVQYLYSRADLGVIASDKDKYFYWELIKKTDMMANGGLKAHIENQLASQEFTTLLGYEIKKENARYRPQDLTPETKYVLAACYVEASEGHALIASEIESTEFTTLKKNILNGVFSVNAEGKKVNFYSSNMGVDPANGKIVFKDDQYWCLGEASATNVVHDLLPWTDNAENSLYPVLSDNEWWYLFRERDHAEKLFAHATVNGKKGLIILPDNWTGVSGISITFTPMSAMSDFKWTEVDKEYYAASDYDAYNKNKINGDDWDKLEYAGAVFLPAALNEKMQGVYWTCTNRKGHADQAYFFVFSKNKLELRGLKGTSTSSSSPYSIRPYQVVK